MQLTRRAVLATSTVGLFGPTSGWLEFALGSGPLEFEGQRVAPTTDALAETGYEEDDVRTETIDESVEFVVERDVRASVWVSEYTKTGIAGDSEYDSSAFVAVSVPRMEAFGRTADPVSEMSEEALIGEFADRANGDVEDVEYVESFDHEILGEDRTVSRLTGIARRPGEVVDVDITLASFPHGDDSIVLLGIHPESLETQAAALETLMSAVEHPW
ncbi:DUF6517 family protein [Natrarchaeobius sp. A-rgal3]|uniref:DUF6517 family protein n=1 Tax=Natrarchaeobius versutus TaxID=1679078 RepID=UPI00350EC821